MLIELLRKDEVEWVELAEGGFEGFGPGEFFYGGGVVPFFVDGFKLPKVSGCGLGIA